MPPARPQAVAGRRPGVGVVDADAGRRDAGRGAGGGHALKYHLLDAAAPLTVAVAPGDPQPLQVADGRVAPFDVADGQGRRPGVHGVGDRAIPVVAGGQQVGRAAIGRPAAVAAGELRKDRRAAVRPDDPRRGVHRIGRRRRLEGDGAAAGGAQRTAPEHLALGRVTDVPGAGAMRPLVGAVGPGGDGLRLEGGRLPRRRGLARDDPEQIVLEAQHVDADQAGRAGPHRLHGAAVVAGGGVRVGQPDVRRAGEAERSGKDRLPAVAVRRPGAAGQRGEVQPVDGRGHPPAGRAGRQGRGATTGEVGDGEAVGGVDGRVVVVVALQQHPDRGGPEHVARRAGVVGGRDLIGALAQRGSALGAPLGHAVAVPPAVPLDAEQTVGRAVVDLLGQRVRRDGDRHAEPAEQGGEGSQRRPGATGGGAGRHGGSERQGDGGLSVRRRHPGRAP